jgi:hypothetical protein
VVCGLWSVGVCVSCYLESRVTSGHRSYELFTSHTVLVLVPGTSMYNSGVSIGVIREMRIGEESRIIQGNRSELGEFD